MALKRLICPILLLLLPHTLTARDPCKTPKADRTTPEECEIDPAHQKWVDFSKKQEEEGKAAIRGKRDPMDCVPVLDDPLSTVWERTGSTTFDMMTFYIIAVPIFFGVIALQIARICKLEIKQETSRDKWGFRVKTLPILPVSMLQESDKDKEFKRVKRNTVGWYCQKWFFYTNDMIREIAVEDAPPGAVNNPWDKIRFLGRLYSLFRKTANQKHQWDSLKKKGKDTKEHKEDYDFKKLFPTVKVERKIELQIRQPQLKKLWFKLKDWIDELPERSLKHKKLQKKKQKLISQKKLKGPVKKVEKSDSSGSWGDSEDSYWGSSESYSSDHTNATTLTTNIPE